MKMKPKSTALLPRALLYKRYNDIEQGYNINAYYKTSDNKYWVYDSETFKFNEIASSVIDTTKTQITVQPSQVFQYQGHYYKYQDNEWKNVSQQQTTTKLKFGNIGKYQTNKYYYVGTFTYMVKGGIEDSTTQIIRGNITPLENLQIQYYNDYINAQSDDLVVIGNKLYSVENVIIDKKYTPKEFRIYSCILNNIL